MVTDNVHTHPEPTSSQTRTEVYENAEAARLQIYIVYISSSVFSISFECVEGFAVVPIISDVTHVLKAGQLHTPQHRSP